MSGCSLRLSSHPTSKQCSSVTTQQVFRFVIFILYFFGNYEINTILSLEKKEKEVLFCLLICLFDTFGTRRRSQGIEVQTIQPIVTRARRVNMANHLAYSSKLPIKAKLVGKTNNWTYISVIIEIKNILTCFFLMRSAFLLWPTRRHKVGGVYSRYHSWPAGGLTDGSFHRDFSRYAHALQNNSSSVFVFFQACSCFCVRQLVAGGAAAAAAAAAGRLLGVSAARHAAEAAASSRL